MEVFKSTESEDKPKATFFLFPRRPIIARFFGNNKTTQRRFTQHLGLKIIHPNKTGWFRIQMLNDQQTLWVDSYPTCVRYGYTEKCYLYWSDYARWCLVHWLQKNNKHLYIANLTYPAKKLGPLLFSR